MITARQRNLNLRLAELDGLINAHAAMVPMIIEQFKMAALRGNAKDAEKYREEVLQAQGEIMDNIYARTCLMREAGII